MEVTVLRIKESKTLLGTMVVLVKVLIRLLQHIATAEVQVVVAGMVEALMLVIVGVIHTALAVVEALDG